MRKLVTVLIIGISFSCFSIFYFIKTGSILHTILFSLLLITLTYLLILIMLKDRGVKYTLLFPAVFALFCTTMLPFGYMLYTSFFAVTTFTFHKKWTFVGFSNYLYLLKDRNFWRISFRTVEYLFFTVGLQVVIGLGIALLLFREYKGKKIVQTILLMPVLATPVVVAMIWKYFFDIETGFLNKLLRLFLLSPQPWLSMEEGLPIIKNIPYIGPWLVKNFNFIYAFWAIVIVNVWQWTPFCFLVFFAGLNALPQDPYEAALVDGATRWKVFKYITLPLLKPVILVVILIRVIDVLKVYAQIWVLVGNSINVRVLNIHLYTLGFITHEYGKTSALGILTFIFTSIFAFVLIRKVYRGGT